MKIAGMTKTTMRQAQQAWARACHRTLVPLPWRKPRTLRWRQRAGRGYGKGGAGRLATGSRSGAGHWSARDVGPLGSLAACRCRGGKPRHARGLARGAGLLVGCAANAPASVVATMAAVAWAPPSLASCVATRRSIARKRARNPRGATRLAGVRALASPSRGNMPDQRHHPAGSRERAAAGPAPQGGKTLNADEGTLPRNSLRPRARAHPQQRVITSRTAERRAPKPEPVATWKTVVATSTPAESFDHRSADLTALESSSLSSGAGRATA